MQKSKTAQNKHHDVHLKTSAKPVHAVQSMCAWEGLLLQKRGKKSRSQEVGKSKVMQLQKITRWKNTEEIPQFKSFIDRVSF